VSLRSGLVVFLLLGRVLIGGQKVDTEEGGGDLSISAISVQLGGLTPKAKLINRGRVTSRNS
jgi:hypothetical protein